MEQGGQATCRQHAIRQSRRHWHSDHTHPVSCLRLYNERSHGLVRFRWVVYPVDRLPRILLERLAEDVGRDETYRRTPPSIDEETRICPTSFRMSTWCPIALFASKSSQRPLQFSSTRKRSLILTQIGIQHTQKD